MDKKLNILFLSSWYPTRVLPMAGDFVQNHAAAVAKQANVVLIHVCSDPDIKQTEVVILENRGFKEIVVYVPAKTICQRIFKNITIFKEYFRQVRLLHKDFKFDVIHANVLLPVSIVTRFIGSKYKTSYVVSEHSSRFLRLEFSKIEKLMIRFGAKKSSCMMPVSKDLENAMKKIGIKNSFKVVPNIVYYEKFENAVHEKSNIFRFIHVSSHVDRIKNISGMIQACALLLKDNWQFEFHIVGKSLEDEALKQLAKDLQLENNVFFHGNVAHDQMPGKYAHADAFVLFSREETFSIVVAEAMSAGLPVITTRCGGITMELSDEEAVFVKKNDVDGLANAMKAMIAGKIHIDVDILKNFVKDNYSETVVAFEFIEIYKNVICNNV